LLKSFHHPNIVSYIDSFEEGGSFCIVTEFCDGDPCDLQKELRRDGRLSIERVLSILTQLASALAHAHRCGVVHRDVKAGNVFCLRDGRVKLGDFGLSRRLDALGFAATQCGTPAYVAPSILAGWQYDARVDIWSLGVLTYELLTGALPFQSLPDVFERDPLPLPAEVPPALANLVAEMLVKRDEARPTAKQVEAAAVLRRLPVVVWRDLKVRDRRNQATLQGLQRTYAGRVTLLACESSEEAFDVLAMACTIDANKVFVITNRGENGVDTGVTFIQGCRAAGVRTHILMYCNYVQNLPHLQDVLVSNRSHSVEQFIERVVLRPR
jgi:serine/threonine protein kinase